MHKITTVPMLATMGTAAGNEDDLSRGERRWLQLIEHSNGVQDMFLVRSGSVHYRSGRDIINDRTPSE